MTGEQIRELRKRLRLNQTDFGRLVGVDIRSIIRWEAGHSRPTGAGFEVLNALREILDKGAASEEALLSLVQRTLPIGGLGYFLLKLLDTRFPSSAS